MNKLEKRVWRVLLVVFLQSLPLSALAWNYTKDDMTKTVELKGLTKSACCVPSPAGAFTVPSQITINKADYTVVSIGPGAFSNCTALTKVTLPSTVTTIRGYAFVGCKNLETISFAAPSITMYQGAFENCPAWTNFVTSSSNYSVIDGVLYSADATSLIRVPIGLTSLNLPASVSSMKEFALHNSNVKTLHFPKGLIEYDASALKSLPHIDSFTVDAENPAFVALDGVLYSKDRSILLRCPVSRTNLIVRAGTTELASGACSHNVDLASVTFPTGFATMAADSLLDCTSLTSVTFMGDVVNTFALGAGGIAYEERKKITLRIQEQFKANWETALTNSLSAWPGKVETFTPASSRCTKGVILRFK